MTTEAPTLSDTCLLRYPVALEMQDRLDLKKMRERIAEAPGVRSVTVRFETFMSLPSFVSPDRPEIWVKVKLAERAAELPEFVERVVRDALAQAIVRA